MMFQLVDWLRNLVQGPKYTSSVIPEMNKESKPRRSIQAHATGAFIDALVFGLMCKTLEKEMTAWPVSD